MDSPYSSFQIENIAIRNLSINKPVCFQSKLRVTYGFSLSIRYGIKPDDEQMRFAVLEGNFRIVEGEDVSIKEDSSGNILDVSLRIQAFFRCAVQDIDEEKFIDMVKKNGVASLIQITRARLSTIFSICDIPSKIILPNVNVLKIENWDIAKIEQEQ